MIGLTALLLAAATQRPPAADSVDRFVVAEMRRQRVPGLGLAVISHGRVVKARGYGFANLELRVPATDSTMFQSGSVGKQFTAARKLGKTHQNILTFIKGDWRTAARAAGPLRPEYDLI